jgi:Flp pilus assembly protein TadD
MKLRIISGLAVAALALALAGCTTPAAEEPADSGTSTATEAPESDAS